MTKSIAQWGLLKRAHQWMLNFHRSTQDYSKNSRANILIEYQVFDFIEFDQYPLDDDYQIQSGNLNN